MRRKGHREAHDIRGLCLDAHVACGNGSPTVDLTKAQVGRLADDDIPEWAHSPGVGLMDTVARLQREVEELRLDPLFNRTGVAPSSPQRSHQTVFTSTKVVNELGSVPTSI